MYKYTELSKQLAVTPRMAPPAARGTEPVVFSRSSAAVMPTTSRTTASMTWETEVGSMFPWPWKKPRKVLIMQISSTQGPRKPMAAQASGWFWNRASWRQNRVMSKLPPMPSPRNMPRAVV